ncbi:hypothetical protein G4B88_025509 [Cannabis sativa]|uniref:Uncharacterized protein n=1 Tax=Cannabis sativa TaxID=3483 RepID=A0A7J6E094_CANSA|nr:hypothetical protein G4B88_025509 [Cannabis sativa]
MLVLRFTSLWVRRRKPENSDSPGEDEDHEDEDEDPDQQLYEELKYGSNMKSMSKFCRKGIGGGGGSISSGLRIRIPTGISIAQPGTMVYAKLDPKFWMIH